MSYSRVPIIVFAFVMCAGFSSPVSATESAISLEDCIAKSLANWGQLKASTHESAAAQAERDSTRGHFLPVFKVDSNLLIWDQRRNAMDVQGQLTPLLGQMSTLLGDFGPQIEKNLTSDQSRAAYQTLTGALQEMSTPQGMEALQDKLLTHKKVTFNAKLTLAQPLTQLYQISAGYKAQDEQAMNLREKERRLRQEIAYSVAHAYYQLIAAERSKDTVSAAIRQTEAIEKQVQSLMEQGLVERNALMKVQVQQANLKRAFAAARMGENIARAALNMYMGRALDEPLEPAPVKAIVPEDDPYFSAGFSQQTDEALRNRPDLKATLHLKKAADWGTHAAIGAALPELNALFSYEYNKGMGAMVSPKTQYYGGLNLSWAFWEWGADYYKVKAAREREAQAREGLKTLTDSIRFDLRQKKEILVETGEELAVTRVALAQARESLRIEQSRYDVQKTTTADLLQAQTQNVQAENNVIVSETRYLDARAALQVALGESIVH